MVDNRYCFKVLRYIFSLACFSAAFGMTIFWCYRFWKDEDLCLVDYLPYEKAVDIPDLTVSVCFRYPFIESRLRTHNTTSDEYVDFLHGTAYRTGLEHIEFEDVTLKPKDFYLGDSLLWMNGTEMHGNYPNHVNKLPRLTFAGTYSYGTPIKCYGLSLPNKKVKWGYFALNTTIMPNSTVHPDSPNDPGNCVKKLFIAFHIADQMILSHQRIDEVCIQNTIDMERVVDIRITNLEILRRRNKRETPCITDYQNYDLTVINELFDKMGCRSLYMQSTRNLSICDITKHEFHPNDFDMDYIHDHLMQPCMSVGDISYRLVYTTYDVNGDNTWELPNRFWLSLTPPGMVKVINQVKDVDIQTVIGNAGGYVGLFVG